MVYEGFTCATTKKEKKQNSLRLKQIHLVLTFWFNEISWLSVKHIYRKAFRRQTAKTNFQFVETNCDKMISIVYVNNLLLFFPLFSCWRPNHNSISRTMLWKNIADTWLVLCSRLRWCARECAHTFSSEFYHLQAAARMHSANYFLHPRESAFNQEEEEEEEVQQNDKF